jgi:N-alpha-acetyltransferase 50
MTIGVLAAYRRRRIGRQLLDRVLHAVEKGGDVLGEVTEVYLHVQTCNDAALDFYTSAGFEKGELIQGYYKRIDPPDCYVVRKTITRDSIVAAAASD